MPGYYTAPPSGGSDTAPSTPATIEDILTPASGFFIDSGAYFVIGNEVIVPFAGIGNSAIALVAGTNVTVGNLTAAIRPRHLPNFADFITECTIQSFAGTTFVEGHCSVNALGDVKFQPHASAASGGWFFNLENVRWFTDVPYVPG